MQYFLKNEVYENPQNRKKWEMKKKKIIEKKYNFSICAFWNYSVSWYFRLWPQNSPQPKLMVKTDIKNLKSTFHPIMFIIDMDLFLGLLTWNCPSSIFWVFSLNLFLCRISLNGAISVCLCVCLCCLPLPPTILKGSWNKTSCRSEYSLNCSSKKPSGFHILNEFLWVLRDFQSIDPLGRCFLYVEMSLCVCLSVHFLRYRLNVFLPPLFEVGCPKF